MRRHPRDTAREYPMKIHHLTVGEAFASLKRELSGLNDAEAQRRLAEFGANDEALLLNYYAPWGNKLFRTASIGAAVWRFILAFALGMALVRGTAQVVCALAWESAPLRLTGYSRTNPGHGRW